MDINQLPIAGVFDLEAETFTPTGTYEEHLASFNAALEASPEAQQAIGGLYREQLLADVEAAEVHEDYHDRQILEALNGRR